MRALDGGVLILHVDFKKAYTVALSNLRIGHVALSNLRNVHVPCHYHFILIPMSHVTKA